MLPLQHGTRRLLFLKGCEPERVGQERVSASARNVIRTASRASSQRDPPSLNTAREDRGGNTAREEATRPWYTPGAP